MLAKQIDPQDHQKEQIRNTLEAKKNTFQLVAERWWEVKKSTVTEDYGNDIWRPLERDVFPAIGDIRVTDIKAHKGIGYFNSKAGNIAIMPMVT